MTAEAAVLSFLIKNLKVLPEWTREVKKKAANKMLCLLMSLKLTLAAARSCFLVLLDRFVGGSAAAGCGACGDLAVPYVTTFYAMGMLGPSQQVAAPLGWLLGVQAPGLSMMVIEYN